MNTQKSLIIANPCHENWGKMSPTEKGKFCQSCSKEVIDFTKKSKEDVIHYLENYKGEGQTCGQFRAEQIDYTGKSYINSSIFKRIGISFMTLLAIISFKEAKAQKGKIKLRGAVAYHDYSEQKMDVTLYGSVKNLDGEIISGAIINFSHEGKELGSTQTFANGTYTIKLKVDKSMKAIMMRVNADGYESKYNIIPEPQKEKIRVDFIMESEIMMLGEIAIVIDTIQTDTTKMQMEIPVKDSIIDCTNTTVNETDSLEKLIIPNPELPIDLPKENDSLFHKNPWIDDKKFINIYPNPSSFNATVEWKDNSEMRIELFDLNGKLIWSTQSKGNKVVINTANLPTGNYQVKLTSKLTGKSENAALIITR